MNCKIVVNAYIRNKSQIKQAERLAEELTLLGADCEIIKNVSLAEKTEEYPQLMQTYAFFLIRTEPVLIFWKKNA